MKLHHTKYKQNYREYILSTIESGINGEDLTTEDEKLRYIRNRFYSETGCHGWPRMSAVADWLSGMALDIEYDDYSILELAVEMGSLDEKHSQATAQRVVENYWNFMANIVMGMIMDGSSLIHGEAA